MGKPKDIIWKYAQEIPGGWRCNFCQIDYKGYSGRIEKHLVEICRKASDDIKNEAELIMLEKKKNKKRSKKRKREENSGRAPPSQMPHSSSPEQGFCDGIEGVNPAGQGVLPVVADNIFGEIEGVNPAGRGVPPVVAPVVTDNVFDRIDMFDRIEWGEPVGQRSRNNGDGLPNITFESCSSLFRKLGMIGSADNSINMSNIGVAGPSREGSVTNQRRMVHPDFYIDSPQYAQPNINPPPPSSRAIEIQEHVKMVSESWKKTGFTMILFNLQNERERPLDDITYVCGIYCPKGLIFVGVPHPQVYYDRFLRSFKKSSPRIDISDLTLEIFHHKGRVHGEECLCKLTVEDSIISPEKRMRLPCLSLEIKKMCVDVCRRSGWVQGLVKKASLLLKYLCDDESMKEWYIKLLREKGKRFPTLEDITTVPGCSLSNLFDIKLLETKLKVQYDHRFKHSKVQGRNHINAIFEDSKFWKDAGTVKEVITLTSKISNLMDTLVPTIGYLAMAIDKVKNTVFQRNQHSMGEDALEFWQEIESKLRGTIEGSDKQAASYLNPTYFLQHVLEDPEHFQEKVKAALEAFAYTPEAKEEVQIIVDKELKFYGDVFSKLEEYQLQKHHPVRLWEDYGHELPHLQKHAIKILSQPSTCMCNQVKKHMYQLQGAHDYITRLNEKMMEEFKSLGDDIYKPIDLSQIDEWL